MISVVIPAHQEAAVIGRTLRTLVAGAAAGELHVVVACNGCTDGTADVARSVPGPIEVVETPHPGKPGALDLGDRHAVGFPRAYVDADVLVDVEALRRCADVLRRPGVLATAPRIDLDLEGASPAVRAYYRQWLRSRYVTRSMIGSGVYVLSAEGRRRFGAFPDIIADDLFVHGLFAPEERPATAMATFRKQAPADLRTVLAVKGRMYAGHLQLHELRGDAPHAAGRARPDVRGVARDLISPHGLDALVYAGVNLAARVRAQAKVRRGATHVWERDETSRRA